MRSKAHILTVLLVLLALRMPTVAAAAECNNIYKDDVPVRLNSCDFPVPVYHDEDSNGCLGPATEEAVDQWNAVSPWPGVDLFVFMGAYGTGTPASSVHVGWGSASQGRNDATAIPGTDDWTFDIDIPEYFPNSGGDYYVTCSDPLPSDEFCASEVVAHELGHVLGLGHLLDGSTSGPLMFESGFAGFCTTPSYCDGQKVGSLYNLSGDAMEIVDLEATPTYDPASSTWDVTVTFNTTLSADATIKVDTNVAACGGTPDPVFLASDVDLLNHSFVIEDVPDDRVVTYSVSAIAGRSDGDCQPTATETVLLCQDDGFESVQHSVNRKFCSVDVDWVTCMESTNNGVFYQETIGGTLYFEPAAEADCVANRSYSATLMLPPNTEWRFYVKADIGGVSVYGDWTVVSIGAGKGCLGMRKTVASEPASPPNQFRLDASPNPFNPAAEIRFETTQTSQVQLTVYDMRGRLVNRLVDEVRSAGDHSVTWNGTTSTGQAVPSGVYFVVLNTPYDRLVHKLAMVK